MSKANRSIITPLAGRPSPGSDLAQPGQERSVDEPAGMGNAGVHQIGEAADRVGLSLRTVRYYEEVGLVAPSGRTQGGFRLYTEADIERLALIKQMKPLGFSLEQMRELLETRERLQAGRLGPAEQAQCLERLAAFAAAATEQCQRLRTQLEIAEGFAQTLEREVDKHARTPHAR